MPMIKIYIGSPVDEKEVIVSDEKTPSEVLKENGISLSGSVHVDGRVVSGTRLNQSLAKLGMTDEGVIHVIRKMDGAL